MSSSRPYFPRKKISPFYRSGKCTAFVWILVCSAGDQAILEACGLDPYIGFFHEVTYGRASLSLDLMEEFRHPLVDRLVLKLFNRKMLDDDDFETRGVGQVYLKKNR